MADDYNYGTGYAKTGRSTCKHCKTKIPDGHLRMNRRLQSAQFDGKSDNWYHFTCFFSKTWPSLKSVTDIENYSGVRWEDQLRIKKKVEICAAKELDAGVEYSKNSRAGCRHKDCYEKSIKIVKDEMRIYKLVEPTAEQARYAKGGTIQQWYHADCFFLSLTNEKLELKDLKGYEKLTDDDCKQLKTAIENRKKALFPSKNEKTKKRQALNVFGEDEENKPKKAKNDNERFLEGQTKLIWEVIDNLEKCGISKATIKELLAYNKMSAEGGYTDLLPRLSDAMCFGRLEKCTECGNGDLEYTSGGYKCKGNLSEWTMCENITQKPKRAVFKLPPDFKKSFKYFETFRCRKGTRIFREPLKARSNNATTSTSATTTTTTTTSPAPVSFSASSSVKNKNKKLLKDNRLVLTHYYIAVTGKLTIPQSEIKTIIEKWGGTMCNTVTAQCNMLIANERELEKKTSKIRAAEEKGITILDFGFLEELSKSTTGEVSMEKYILQKEHTEKKIKFQRKSKGENIETIRKVKVKGVAEVDPDVDKCVPELSQTTHVYVKDKVIYSVNLARTDISSNTNSYYKLQLLESDDGEELYLFRSWGRIGAANIGGEKCEDFMEFEHGVQEFCRLFEEKTGNAWEDRQNFEKKPRMFHLLEIVFDNDEGASENAQTQLETYVSQSSLENTIAELVMMIFDIKAFQHTLSEFEIDTEKLPLGKISSKQITEGYNVLNLLSSLFSESPLNFESKVRDLTNRFYTLVPHSFGLNKVENINEEILAEKIKLLENLKEMEIASKIMCGVKKDENPIDCYYLKLKADVAVLSKTSNEFRMIETYLLNTHGKTHTAYKLEIIDAFSVQRFEEKQRFDAYPVRNNVQLLWHGSRVTNFAGIISQGLRIAPPEAPVTGYMFGKGVYFADMVTKSANYCMASRDRPEGLLMLCEVILGNMYELKKAKFIEKLPKDMHSTKGLGRNIPSAKGEVVLENGVTVPCGLPVARCLDTALLYNEYIVYDIAQINIKYVLKVKFNYK